MNFFFFWVFLNFFWDNFSKLNLCVWWKDIKNFILQAEISAKGKKIFEKIKFQRKELPWVLFLVKLLFEHQPVLSEIIFKWHFFRKSFFFQRLISFEYHNSDPNLPLFFLGHYLALLFKQFQSNQRFKFQL